MDVIEPWFNYFRLFWPVVLLGLVVVVFIHFAQRRSDSKRTNDLNNNSTSNSPAQIVGLINIGLMLYFGPLFIHPNIFYGDENVIFAPLSVPIALFGLIYAVNYLRKNSRLYSSDLESAIMKLAFIINGLFLFFFAIIVLST